MEDNEGCKRKNTAEGRRHGKREKEKEEEEEERRMDVIRRERR